MSITIEYILVTIVASLLSGIIGVVVSFYFYSRLERRKMKIETARKLFGAKHEMHGKEFQEAMNELMIVFSDSDEVMSKMENLWTVVATPPQSRGEKAADDAMINLMKSMCRNIGIKYKNLSDTYFLKCFKFPQPSA